MSFYKRIKSLDQTFSWSFFGCALGIVFFLVSLYTTFIYAKNPKLQIEILAEGPVYDIRENVSKLDILFDGENIRQKQQTLSLLNIRVINRGNADIFKGYYDDNSPLVIRVNGARIISAESTGGSNQYLRDHAKSAPIGENELRLAPLILEQNEYFTLKLLVLHLEGVRPQVEGLGKVAGVQSIDVVKAPAVQSISFLQRVAGGDLLTQISRFVIYAIGGLGALIALGVTGSWISNWNQRRQRRKFVRKFKQDVATILTDREAAILEQYKVRGEGFVLLLCDLMRDADALSAALSRYGSEAEIEPDAVEPTEFPSHPVYLDSMHGSLGRRRALKFLLDNRIVTVTDGNATVDPGALGAINRFESFLLALVPRRMRRQKISDMLDDGDAGTPTAST